MSGPPRPGWHDPRLLETRTLDTPAPLPAPRDAAEWQRRARRLRIQILAAAGLWADPAEMRRAAPAAEIFERREHPDLGYSVEKVFFESLPGHVVTGNLYRPLGGRGPRPGVLHPHGHAARGRLQHDALFSPALRGITCARMGMVAFVYDMAGYGDSVRIPHRWGGPSLGLWGASPLGLQLWNSIRALDLLEGLPDVDPGRLGCTGESGGGTQTFLLTAVDPRVAVSAPVNMVSAHMQGGCVCENAPGLRLDTSNVEIAALCAPRPLLLVSATGDWTRETPRVEFPAVQAVYDLLGARERVATVQFDAPHNYNRQSREAVYGFLARHLGGPGAVPSEDDVPGPDAEDDIRVFARRPWPDVPSGEAAVEAVGRWFRGQAAEARRALDPSGARARLLPYLQAVTGVDAPGPGEVQARPDPTGGGAVWLSRRGAAERFLFREGDAAAPVRLLHRDGTLWGGIWPFGTGRDGAPWARAGRAAEDDHFLCYNRADAAWAARDLLSALAWAGGRAARVEAGPECVAAAALARAIAGDAVEHLTIELGPEWAAAGGSPSDEAAWMAGGQYLPGVLRAGGLAGLLAMAAPAPLRVRAAGRGDAPPAWPGLERLRHAYAAAGAGDACAIG